MTEEISGTALRPGQSTFSENERFETRAIDTETNIITDYGHGSNRSHNLGDDDVGIESDDYDDDGSRHDSAGIHNDKDDDGNNDPDDDQDDDEDDDNDDEDPSDGLDQSDLDDDEDGEDDVEMELESVGLYGSQGGERQLYGEVPVVYPRRTFVGARNVETVKDGQSLVPELRSLV